ncbi:MAG: LysR family transcriptional regulator [Deltaproteobacteria bacterium]|jgi:DNA-binding transcriptional LysR family regulator|nr:LysR family transcriptional regulator [Deltaproteobacteria bacterium]
MQINLNQLRTFYLAAREKSITRAAEALHVTQPAVTMQIKAFENQLDVRLFRKYGKELLLTDVGQVLYSYTKRMFKIVDEMEYVLKSYGDLTQGSLTIGTTRSFARHLMPGLLSRFQESFPKVKVFLKVGSSQEIADSIAAFKYDMGIIGRLPHLNKLKVVPYTKEEFCVVISPNHRLAAKSMVSIFELKNEPIIIRESGSGSRHAILSLLASHDVKPSVLVEAGSVEFIKEYIIKERGISFLYKPEIELEAKMGLLKPLDINEGPIWVQTDIVFARRAKLSPPAEAFLRIIKSDL